MKIFSICFGCTGQIWYVACQSRISTGFSRKKKELAQKNKLKIIKKQRRKEQEKEKSSKNAKTYF